MFHQTEQKNEKEIIRIPNCPEEIDVIVNEGIKSKIAFTSQDKYNRLNEINPNVELLKKTFDLDI